MNVFEDRYYARIMRRVSVTLLVLAVVVFFIGYFTWGLL